jgi:hypothetical protein
MLCPGGRWYSAVLHILATKLTPWTEVSGLSVTVDRVWCMFVTAQAHACEQQLDAACTPVNACGFFSLLLPGMQLIMPRQEIDRDSSMTRPCARWYSTSPVADCYSTSQVAVVLASTLGDPHSFRCFRIQLPCSIMSAKSLRMIVLLAHVRP